MLGTKALQVFDETTCVVRAVLRWTEFYAHESCGKCTPCREGTYWLVQILRRLEAGKGTEADLDKLLDICDNILGRSFCALGDGAASPIISSLKYFREEYVEHIAGRAAAPSTPPPSTVFARPRTGARDRDDRHHGHAPDAAGRQPAPEDLVTAHHRRRRGQRAQGHPGHPRRRADRHPDPALLRPPAARPGRRLPPVPRRGRGPAQAAGVLHHHRHRRHGRARPSSPRRSPTRRSRA